MLRPECKPDGLEDSVWSSEWTGGISLTHCDSMVRILWSMIWPSYCRPAKHHAGSSRVSSILNLNLDLNLTLFTVIS